MIGDDKAKDIMSANKVGMKSILYDYTGKKNEKECNVKDYIVVRNFDEVLEILKI